MKRPIWTRVLALVLAVLLTGCAANTPSGESTTPSTTNTPNTTENEGTANSGHEHNYIATEVVDATCSAEGYTVYVCNCGDTYNGDFAEKSEHTYEETVIPPTSESEGYTLYMCTVCSYAYKDNYTDKVVDDGLTAEQRNSIAMLNYLATLTQEINASRNSRMFLEEAYASLINNTNPEEVNELTESHLCSLLDTIEEYRVIAVKRERLEYLYNQNKARAIREAIPNPMAVLSAATSLDVKRLVASVAYMAVDSTGILRQNCHDLVHRGLDGLRQIAVDFLPLVLVQLFPQLHEKKVDLRRQVGILLCLVDQTVDFLLRLCFDVLPQPGLELEQLILLLAENIVAECASQAVDTLLREVPLILFSVG